MNELVSRISHIYRENKGGEGPGRVKHGRAPMHTFPTFLYLFLTFPPDTLCKNIVHGIIATETTYGSHHATIKPSN